MSRHTNICARVHGCENIHKHIEIHEHNYTYTYARLVNTPRSDLNSDAMVCDCKCMYVLCIQYTACWCVCVSLGIDNFILYCTSPIMKNVIFWRRHNTSTHTYHKHTQISSYIGSSQSTQKHNICCSCDGWCAAQVIWSRLIDEKKWMS